MDRRTNTRIRTALLAAALATMAGAPAATRASDEPKRCCFANPGYSGTCQVDLHEGETCASVLSYLNNPRASGKNYCGSTQVRGGWRSIACEKPKE